MNFLDDDSPDIPTMWQWRFVLLNDGTLKLCETYWNGDRLLAYSEESQPFDAEGLAQVDPVDHFVDDDAFLAVSRAMELPVLHVDQLPPQELKDSIMRKIFRQMCKTMT